MEKKILETQSRRKCSGLLHSSPLSDKGSLGKIAPLQIDTQHTQQIFCGKEKMGVKENSNAWNVKRHTYIERAFYNVTN